MTDEELAAVEKRAASVAAYHGEHAAFGGASFEFHARAQTTVADLFDEIRRLRDRLAAFDSCDRARRAAEEEVVALKAEVARLTFRSEAYLDGMTQLEVEMNAEVARLREDVAAARWSAWLLAWQAIGHTAAGVFAVDLALNTPPRSVCAHCQAEHEVESGAMAAHVRACPSNPLAQEVAALKADADRLYDATGFTVPEMIAHDEAMDAQAAALKAEVASLSARFEEACADATRAEADRDAWHNIANKHEADAERLAGVAREACDFAAAAMDNAPCADSHDDADQSALYAGRERIADLRAAIPTPDPAAFVAAVEWYGKVCGVLHDRGIAPGDAGLDGTDAAWVAEHDAARSALLALGGVR